LTAFPQVATDRDAWILSRRPQRNVVDPLRPWGFFVEEERSASGEIVPVATIFLTNRECPWRCLMCDLWRNTLPESGPAGAIPAQIEYALGRLPLARQIKLYSSGSFFDRRAIPPEDYPAIASLLTSFEQVIVECHPALVGSHCMEFRALLGGRLEIAMGLETVHKEILGRLNKRMTLEQFEESAFWLRANDVDLRVFILVKPPFMDEEMAAKWAAQSLDFAFNCGASAATIIPTRGGNGAMEDLAASGDFSPPLLSSVEAAMAYGISLDRGRIFVDLGDLGRQTKCNACHAARIARLDTMNREQRVMPPVNCERCGGRS
jgi:radical SAM enzyme (TIGR01210 family)